MLKEQLDLVTKFEEFFSFSHELSVDTEEYSIIEPQSIAEKFLINDFIQDSIGYLNLSKVLKTYENKVLDKELLFFNDLNKITKTSFTNSIPVILHIFQLLEEKDSFKKFDDLNRISDILAEYLLSPKEIKSYNQNINHILIQTIN
jgi:hypothetical protein